MRKAMGLIVPALPEPSVNSAKAEALRLSAVNDWSIPAPGGDGRGAPVFEA
jgi:hypothetical protein